jgi:hypothetical protein
MKSMTLLIACLAVPTGMCAASGPSAARSQEQIVSPGATAVISVDDIAAAKRKAKTRAKSKSKGGGHLGHH